MAAPSIAVAEGCSLDSTAIQHHKDSGHELLVIGQSTEIFRGDEFEVTTRIWKTPDGFVIDQVAKVRGVRTACKKYTGHTIHVFPPKVPGDDT